MGDDHPLKPWEVRSSTPLGDFKVFRVRKDVSVSPVTGAAHDFFVLDAPDWVNVVAVTPAQEVVLIRQWRAGTRGETLEIPGGGVEMTDADALLSARRELREETGFDAERWTEIGCIRPNPAIQGNRCTTFLAEGAYRAGDAEPDGGEDIRVELRSVADLDDLVRKGEIRHGIVVAALHFFALHRRASR